jgi:hypothetical protein
VAAALRAGMMTLMADKALAGGYRPLGIFRQPP